ncbi:MAG: hypothetical protein HCA25_00615 (plasmid) [Dolichospermum sp. DET50]|nr:hypothetical protein [Dolichospermum sp. DET66]MBS3036004.1 hypothetical protein [Dolichospermum sp. DET67]MBS3041172.1 hypothetical protein [Dolichospermum sp. DET50]QSX70911.1 MAG: hypothetical protein EZY12_27340 [Dolichospermum sp. DET69]
MYFYLFPGENLFGVDGAISVGRSVVVCDRSVVVCDSCGALRYRLFEISPKKILHGVLNSGFPQPDFFPQENLAVVFP